MVVDDLNVGWTARATRPFETNAPLLVDADAELSGAAALQGFQPVAAQRTQLVQTDCRIEYFEPPIGLAREALKLSDETAFDKGRGPLVPIAQDHCRSLVFLRNTSIVQIIGN